MSTTTNRLLSIVAAFAATATLAVASSAPLPATTQIATLAVPTIAA
ncbi:hypothetical protein [Sphingomonas sp.]|nr:hypothetical protein [Sphingomonas sp.]HWK35454.1 hypothetical protein [Sphingomonas sp.]